MRNNKLILASLLLVCTLMLSGCYNRRQTPRQNAISALSEKQRDSISFSSKHHYSQGFNFVVRKDSLVLLKQQPEESLSGLLTDTLVFHRHEHVVVADVRMLPADEVDSVWIQLANDQNRFGWVHESEMLPKVVPDDSISQFILTFSDQHLLISLIFITVIAVGYLLRQLFKKKSYVVLIHDIGSFYPTLLCLIVAMSAAFYASIQMFAPDTWQQFYFHPTLNPFSVPPILSLFLCSVWAMLIVAIAAADQVIHLLDFTDALTYLLGLGAVCAANYIIFSIATLYYIGYPLLIAYVCYAVWRFLKRNSVVYYCGNCGATLHRKGRCPHCGAYNV